MKATIKSVQAVRGVVDRLYWTVEVEAPSWNERGFVFADWVGDMVFHTAAASSSTWGQSHAACPGLPATARWLADAQGTRFEPRTKRILGFSVDLPREGLARIEEFREGGSLHARLEGEFMVFKSGGYVEHPVSGVLSPDVTLVEQFAWQGGQVRDRLLCESWPISRDTWNQEVLGKLRPEHRVILELSIPTTGERGEHARVVLGKLREAQKEFDEGRYKNVPALVYKAQERMSRLTDGLEARHGDICRQHANLHRKHFGGLCNVFRHDRDDGAGDLDDRILAQHLLVVGKSLAAVYLRGGSSDS